MICSSLCRVLLLTFSSLGSGELTFQMVEFSGIGQNQQGSARISCKLYPRCPEFSMQ